MKKEYVILAIITLLSALFIASSFSQGRKFGVVQHDRYNIAGRYNASGVSLSNGEQELLQLDSSGNLKVSSVLAQGNIFIGGSDGYAEATSSIYISSNGYVGIGTTTPTQALELGLNDRIKVSTNETTATNNASIELQFAGNEAKSNIVYTASSGMPVIWLAGHDYLSYPGNRHQHFSIETKNGTDDTLQSRFECLWGFDDDDAGGYCGVASSYDLRVGSGGDLEIVDGDIHHQSTFDMCPNNQTTNCIRISTSTDSNPLLTAIGSDTLRVDDNIEIRTANPLIYLNSSATSDYASTLRLTGESTQDNFQGGYMQYDASGNIFIIGVHDTANELTSSDIEVLTITRDGTKVGIGTTSPHTELTVNGNITGNFYYGEMYMMGNATATAIAVQDTYYKIGDGAIVNSGLLNGATHSNGTTTVTNAGVYRISVSISSSGGANSEYHYQVFVNNTAKNNCHFSRKMGAAGDIGSISATCIVRLSAGDALTTRVENKTGTTEIVIVDYNFNFSYIGL